MSNVDPLLFSLLGMAIVFCGLVVISLYIVALPMALDLCARIRARAGRGIRAAGAAGPAAGREAAEEDEADILCAIAVAFHLDQDFPAADQKMTWKSHGDMDSAWLKAGIAHGLAVRGHIHISRRRG